jgi:SAM-dependent methyltransferase
MGGNILKDEQVRYWDVVSQEWTQGQSHHLWRTHSDEVNLGLLRRWLPAGSVEHLLKTDLFDELVSEGLCPFLSGRANAVFGIDLSPLTLHSVRGWSVDPSRIAADVRHLPFPENSFDVIVSNSTLDHFHSAADIASSLRELHRVLRAGGLMILTLDNPINPAIFLRNRLSFRMLHRLRILPYYVGVTLRPKPLKDLFEETGFNVLDVDAIMHCPRILAVPVSDWIEKCSGPKSHKRFLNWLLAFERLSNWPTRFFTGHFTAVKAVKRFPSGS